MKYEFLNNMLHPGPIPTRVAIGYSIGNVASRIITHHETFTRAAEVGFTQSVIILAAGGLVKAIKAEAFPADQK